MRRKELYFEMFESMEELNIWLNEHKEEFKNNVSISINISILKTGILFYYIVRVIG